MTFWGPRNIAKLGSATTVLALCSGLVHAQDDGGVKVYGTLSQGLTYSDENSDENGTFARTNLEFGLSSITRRQSIEFDINTGLNTGFDNETDVSIIDPRTTLSYGIQSRQTALTADLSFVRADADSVSDDPAGTLGELIIDDGTRETIDAGLALDFGREARFGGALSFDYGEDNHSDTVSPDLVNAIRTSAGLSFRFELDSQVTTTLAYLRSETNRETGRDVVNESLNAGAELAISPTLQADLSVGVREISVTDSGVTTNDEGVSYGINVTQTRSARSLDYSLNSDISEAGRRTTATIGTTFETRRGELSTSLGLSDGTDSSLRPVLSLGYSEVLPRGGYSVSFNQSFSTDIDGNETRDSLLRLVWQQDLSTTSRIGSDLTYRMTDELNADTDTARLELGLQFSQDLTEDWAITTRYSHVIIDQDGASTQRENEFFIGLETSFEWLS